MKLLSIIFLTLAVILAVIACILPNWSKNEIILDMKYNKMDAKADMSRNDGLWLKCEKYTGSYPGAPTAEISIGKFDTPDWYNGCKHYGSPGYPEPEGNLASKILSIVGPSLLLISVLLIGIGTNHSKLVGIVGIWCLLALVLVYPLLVLNHNIKDEKSICNIPIFEELKQLKPYVDLTCHTGTLSISYFLEIGAIAIGIIGLMIPIHTGKRKK